MIQENKPVITKLPVLSAQEEDDVMALAAVGFMPPEIAMYMKWPQDKRIAFCMLANTPGSEIAILISAGRISGRADSHMKLHAAAKDGNIDAIKMLREIQADNRFNELVSHMDNDELTD